MGMMIYLIELNSTNPNKSRNYSYVYELIVGFSPEVNLFLLETVREGFIFSLTCTMANPNFVIFPELQVH
jgi:hypothetical protein